MATSAATAGGAVAATERVPAPQPGDVPDSATQPSVNASPTTQPQPQPLPKPQPTGIAFADAVQLLSNRKACDHAHSVRHFFEGAPLTPEQLAAAKAAFPVFESPVDADVRGWGALQLLVHLFRLQEARVRTYRVFDGAFAALLETRNFTPYRLACQRVTRQFSQLSSGVRLVRECLRAIPGGGMDGAGGGHAAPGGLCESITQLQAAEKRKLEATARLQVLRQHLTLRREETAARAHARDGDDGSGGDRDHHDDDHHGHCDHDAEAGPASLADLEEAVQLQSTALASIVEEINDIVDELRCERADMVEE